MSIIFHEESKTFHLFNDEISYIICVLPNGHIGNLYFGKKIHDREDFSYLIESKQRPMTACVYEGNRKYSLEHLKLEYPVYGTSDYRNPAVRSCRRMEAESQNLNISVMRSQMANRSLQVFRLLMWKNQRKPRLCVCD